MRFTALALVVSLFVLNTGSAEAAAAAKADAQDEASAWRKVAETIPVGSKVKVQTYEGKRVSGVLMRADSTEVLVKRNTRLPEPAVAVAYQDMARIEREKDGGFNVGKAVAIGLAAGGGAMLTLILFAVQLD